MSDAVAACAIESRSAIFLQPHSDDVALSCGGAVAQNARAGHSPRVIGVFAGEVHERMVGALAREKHARWNLHDVDDMTRTRRAEDARAMQALGATIRWLGMPDAIYRGERYPSNVELFGPLHADEQALADHLAEELSGLPEWDEAAAVFVPLGIGNHADHQVLFETGRKLAARGLRVLAYEDTPYVIHSPQGLDARLAEIGESVGEPVLLCIEADLAARLEAIAAYESQVPVIFRYTDDWRASVASRARELGGGRAAERFWPVRAA